MKHLLIILSILFFTTFLVSCEEETYVGERENGTFHGQGTLTLPTGDKYVGGWKDGKKHGQGTYTWSEGSKYVGEWKNGREWKGTIYWKNGKIKYKIMNVKTISP